MRQYSTSPRAHADAEFLSRKLTRIDEPHVHPLNDFVRVLRAETDGEVPWFDPDTGGVRAKVLVLLEAPGRRAAATTGLLGARGGSGIVSLDNQDDTAAALWQLYEEAGLRREDVVIWNVVPWYIGTAKAIRSAENDDLIAARPYLLRLFALLPELRVVVAVGEKAREGWLAALLNDDAPIVPTLASPHPSPRVLRRWPERRLQMLAALHRAAVFVGDVEQRDEGERS